MKLLTRVNRNLDLIQKARQLDSKKHSELIYPELKSWLQSSQINLYCVDQDYFLDNFKMDFSFYYHPVRTIVLNFSSIDSLPLKPFWGADFSLSYNLILIHEIGHFLSFQNHDFSENGAWWQGLKLAEQLKLFSPELTQWLQNYFIV